jgi:hypothetical protein
MYDQIFGKTSCSLSKKINMFAKFFGENILKIIISFPGRTPSRGFVTRKGVNIFRRFLRQTNVDGTTDA